jgi:TRAP transporter TAXI family solute receptor
MQGTFAKARLGSMMGAISRSGVLMGLLTSIAVGLSPAASAQSVSFGTDSIGGISNTVGNAVAKVVSQHSALNVRVRAYGGPEIWLPQLDEGRIHFGAHFSATAWLSYKKIDTKVQTPNLRLVRAGAATVPIGFMVRADSDIKSVADLKGRRVAGGYGAHPIIKRLSEGLLKAYGIDMSEVKLVPVPASIDGAKALQDGRAEAAWYAVFAPSTREIHSKIGVRFLPIDFTPERLKIAREVIFPGIVPVKVPVDLPFAPKGTGLAGYEFYVIASTHTPAKSVMSMSETLWANDSELTKVHANLRGFKNAAAASAIATIPYHEAAIEFYKSKGKWSQEIEAHNQSLLKQ